MIDFIGKRYFFFGLSIVFILLGVISFFRNGFNYDIQFQGGTIMQFQMKDANFEPSKANELLKGVIDKEITVQRSITGVASIGQQTESIPFLIVKVSHAGKLSLDEQNAIINTVKDNFEVEPNVQVSINMVDAAIGKELKSNAILALIISSTLIVLYIWWRFSIMSGLSAGFMAVIGLLHDASVMVSVYLIFGLPVNESFIAAVLTIIGYSMNDTVIIYDRIRENSNLLKKVSVRELVNKSITQTLPRTINTTVAVFLCVATVYAFATYTNVGAIREFAFPLLIGVISGTYSSIFVASPLYVMWKESSLKRVAAQRSKG